MDVDVRLGLLRAFPFCARARANQGRCRGKSRGRSLRSRALTGAARGRGRRLPFQRQEGKTAMLRIYEDVLEWLSALVPLIDQISRHDPDLAKQLKRASRATA